PCHPDTASGIGSAMISRDLATGATTRRLHDRLLVWDLPTGRICRTTETGAYCHRCPAGGRGRLTDHVAVFDPLQFDHIAIKPTAGHQLTVAAGLDDRAVVEHEDAIGMPDRA